VTCAVGVAGAVERGADESEGAQADLSARPEPRKGYESSSGLKTDPAGKSFFFLTNEIGWPEKKDLPAPASLATATPAAAGAVGSQAQQVEKPVTESDKTTNLEPKAQKSAPEKPANAQPAKIDKKQKTAARKPAVSLPDIEQLLDDVRKSAQPRLVAEPPARAAKSSSAAPPAAEPALPVYHEVEVPVDLDDLASDLEKMQREQPRPADLTSTAAAHTDATPWWIMTAACAGLAASVLIAWWLFRRGRQQQKSQIRPQSQIDAETKKFFARLISEQRRRAAAKREDDAVTAMDPAADESPAQPEPAVPEHETLAAGPEIFLLPPELAENEYKEVVRLASQGAPPETISQKLNMGEGEVRLVLDIARLSRGKLAGAGAQ